VVVEGEFSFAGLFWAGLFWSCLFWAVAPLVGVMVLVLVVVVWENNLGGCVAVEDEIVMKDGAALL
jgi:hypothetical protein